MQADFEHLSETLLASEQYLSEILHIIDSKAGVREDDDKRRSVRAVMVESQRRKDETLEHGTILSAQAARLQPGSGLRHYLASGVQIHDAEGGCRPE